MKVFETFIDSSLIVEAFIISGSKGVKDEHETF